MGKHKTVWQIVAVAFFLVLMTLAELERAGFITASSIIWWSYAWFWVGRALVAVVLVLTLYSGVGYLWKNRSLISME
jgi:phosphatidylglycerophosphate synthase